MMENYSMNTKNYSSDSPVSLKGEDRFSRWLFAERIAQVISTRSDPGCITIGLYGAWGDGKTSVLNFIETALSEDGDVICIKFNPWRFTDEESLLVGFFMNVADALDAKLITTGDKLKDFIKKAAPGMGAAVGAQGIGDSVNNFLSGPDIDQLKVRIEHELESTKKRVLIIMDDVDRLEKTEIQALLKLVKLAADFKYTAYILAFDKDIVAASLQERYSSSARNSGEAFLEKIIQVPLHLPTIQKNVLQEFCFKGIDEALAMSNINLSQQQVQEFIRDFTGAFDDSLSTPRRAKLYGNTLMFSLPILRDEVNPIDLMLIEGIRVFCPPLYDAIKKNKASFCGVLNSALYSNVDEEKTRIRGLLEIALETGNVSNKLGYIQLLKNIFPKLQAVYANMQYGSEWYEEWNYGQRICSDNYFDRYFTYAIPLSDIGDATLVDMVDSLKQCEQPIRKGDNPLSALITSENSELLIKKLRHKASSFSKDESISLAITLALECASYPNPESLCSWTVPFSQAAILISDLIQNLPSKDRVALACTCIDSSSCLDFKLEIFQWLKREDKERPEREAFTQTSIDAIGRCLGENVVTCLGENIDITIAYPRSVPQILRIIRGYVGEEYLNEYLAGHFDTNSNFVLRLLDAYTATSWGMESGVSRKSDFERNEYDNVIRIIPADKILQEIEKSSGQKVSVEGIFPYADGTGKEDRSIVFRQFAWIHQYVVKEMESAEEEFDSGA